MIESDAILKNWFGQIDNLVVSYGGSQRNGKSFLTNKAMIEFARTHAKLAAEEKNDVKARANEQTTAAAYMQAATETEKAYVVRVYRYKARKHQVTFLGIGIRTKRPDLTNIQNAKLFDYETAAKIIADTPSVDGVQYHILLHSDAVEKERERANRK